MSIDYYGSLLTDETRIEAFRRALESAVRPGDDVLEIGTGLGTYAFFAARAGAGRVWAVDRSRVVHVAELLAAANDLDDRIEFVRGTVPEVELPDEVDVLVYEDFPTALLDRSTYEMLDRVQTERLAPGARMVPGAARLSVAPVESDALGRSLVPPAVGEDGAYGLDWTAVRPFLAARPRRMKLDPGSLLGVAAVGPRIELLPLPDPDALTTRGEWDAATPGTVHAVALWFDLELSGDEWFSNAPGPEAGPWGQWVLPLDPPLEVESGERLEVIVAREALEDGTPGWLRWEARTAARSCGGHEFGGLLLGPDDLREDVAGAPPRNARGAGEVPDHGHAGDPEPREGP